MSSRKTLGWMALSSVVAVALVGARLRAEDDRFRDRELRDADRYAIDTRMTLATDNDPIPPTLFAHYPTKGSLSFMALGEVLSGRHGDTRLEGAKFAAFGRCPAEAKKPLEALSLYLDDGATSDQRRALAAIFRSDEAFRTDGMVPLATVKIDAKRAAPGALAPVSVRVGDRGAFTVTPVAGKDGKNPIAVVNGFSPFDDREPVILGKATGSFHDHGRDLTLTNGSGEIHYVRFSGAVKGVTEEFPRKD